MLFKCEHEMLHKPSPIFIQKKQKKMTQVYEGIPPPARAIFECYDHFVSSSRMWAGWNCAACTYMHTHFLLTTPPVGI